MIITVLTADDENDGPQEAHDAYALDHDHEVGIGRGVGQHRHDEARHEERESQVGKDHEGHLADPRLPQSKHEIGMNLFWRLN